MLKSRKMRIIFKPNLSKMAMLMKKRRNQSLRDKFLSLGLLLQVRNKMQITWKKRCKSKKRKRAKRSKKLIKLSKMRNKIRSLFKTFKWTISMAMKKTLKRTQRKMPNKKMEKRR